MHCIDKYIVPFHQKHFSHVLCTVASAGIDEIINCIKEEITKKFPALQTLFDEDNLKGVAGEMLAAGIIPHHVAKNLPFLPSSMDSFPVSYFWKVWKRLRTGAIVF